MAAAYLRAVILATPSRIRILILRAPVTRGLAGGETVEQRKFTCRAINAIEAREAILMSWAHQARFTRNRNATSARIFPGWTILARQPVVFGEVVRRAQVAASRRFPPGGILSRRAILAPVGRKIRKCVRRASFTLRLASGDFGEQGIRPIRALGAQPSRNGILVRSALEARGRARGGVRRIACRTRRATGAREAILPRWAIDARANARRKVGFSRIRSGWTILARLSGFGVLVFLADLADRRWIFGILAGGAILATV